MKSFIFPLVVISVMQLSSVSHAAEKSPGEKRIDSQLNALNKAIEERSVTIVDELIEIALSNRNSDWGKLLIDKEGTASQQMSLLRCVARSGTKKDVDLAVLAATNITYEQFEPTKKTALNSTRIYHTLQSLSEFKKK